MKKIIKFVKIGWKVFQIITVVMPVVKGVVLGVIQSYSDLKFDIKALWKSK